MQSNILFDFNSILIGSSIGFIAVAILCVNNIRDIDADKKVRKKTLAVRFGIKKITLLYDIMIVCSYLSILFLFFDLRFKNKFELLLIFLSLPISVKLIYDIHRFEGKELNIILARTALLIRLFSALLFLGIIL